MAFTSDTCKDPISKYCILVYHGIAGSFSKSEGNLSTAEHSVTCGWVSDSIQTAHLREGLRVARCTAVFNSAPLTLSPRAPNDGIVATTLVAINLK